MRTKHDYAKIGRDAFELTVCFLAICVIAYNLAVFGVI